MGYLWQNDCAPGWLYNCKASPTVSCVDMKAHVDIHSPCIPQSYTVPYREHRKGASHQSAIHQSAAGVRQAGTMRASGAMDNASDYGSEDSRFDSWLARDLL